jgi:hypothetical protein
VGRRPGLDVGYHFRRTAVPAPGDDEALRRLVARIMAQRLDRDRPLWECWVIEGLATAPMEPLPGPIGLVVDALGDLTRKATRGYRLPDTVSVFEVDLPANIATKQARVTAALGAVPGHVRLVPVDFETDDLTAALSAAGAIPRTRGPRVTGLGDRAVRGGRQTISTNPRCGTGARNSMTTQPRTRFTATGTTPLSVLGRC